MKIGEKVYYCSRIQTDNAEVETFAKPEQEIIRLPNIFSPISFVVQPKNSYTDKLEQGETTIEDQRAILTPYEYWYGKFKIGDRFYLDGVVPNDKAVYGEGANYYVESVSNQNLAIELSLKKIVER